ncbi:MAG TPA: protein kinase, partial [Pirellulaceae bacterium]|nr:protein kinase [Pirellulaceae bacterium]
GLVATIDNPPFERLGTQIGPYKLLEQIGEGGFGVVYMAEQASPVRRRVALKLIKPGMDSHQVVARFEAERQALAVMDHPHIAKVLDAGTTDSGRPYFVMELVRGVPVTQYCDENSLSVRERLDLFMAICQAIQHAHTKGIIHRDIKPTNVLVTRQDGQPVVKVIDFGIAKAMGQRLTERTLFTGFAQMIGTPLYMSPEQAELSSTDIDTRSDIYSLGVLLYELLTGSTPVNKKQLKEAAFDEIRRIIREDEPPKPSTRISSAESAPSIAAQRHTEPAKLARLVRGELDWIVMKALEKDRNRRYETASGFARDIERYLNDEPVLACPPSAAYRFGKFARRNRGALAIASVAVLSVLLALVGLTVSNVLITQEKNLKVDALEKVKLNEKAANTQKGIAERNATKAREQEQKATVNEKKAKFSELLARRRYYAAQMNLAMQAWEAGQAARVLALLESQRPKIDEEDLRTFEWYYLWRLCQGGLRHRFPTVNHDNSAVLALSPDGLTLASGFGNDVKLWDTLTGQEKKTLSGHSTMVNQLAFTSSGILISSDNVTFRIWNPATAAEQLVPIAGSGNGGDRFAISGDGKILVIDLPAGITLCDLDTGQQSVVEGSAGTNRFGIVAVDAGVQRVAACRDNSLIRVWERDGANWRELPSIPEHGWCPCLAFSPDGKSLAVSGTLRCYDPATGKLQLTPLGHTGGVLSVGYSADGKTLVSTGHDQTARLWDAATGRQLACLAHPVMVYGAALSADGKVAATAGDGVRVWDTTPLDETVILAHTAAVLAVALSRDGKTLASAGNDGTKLWNLPERKEVKSFPPSKDVAFFPDDKALALFRTSGTIELFNITGERQAELKGHTSARSLAVSPDGKCLASACYEPEAILWDLHTRQQRSKLKMSGQLPEVAFSRDGQILAAGSQFGAVKLFEAATGRETATLQRFEFASTFITGLAFSRDSALVAAANGEGQVQVWEIATGRLHAALRGHASTVAGLSFSPDGQTLATASADHTVKLWDVVTGQERFTLKGHKGPVTAVEFMPDGNTLITASEDGTVRLWLAAVDSQAKARKQELDWDVPGTPAACHERGDAFWQYEHLDQAEIAYAEADARLQKLAVAFPESAELKREMVRSLLTRSLLLDETGRTQKAGPLRDRAHGIYGNLTANDQQVLIWEFCERGRKLATMGNHRQAERTYAQAIDLEPTNERARSLRRSTFFAMGDWDKVVVDSSQLIELNPNEAGNWNWRGVAHSRQGQKETALADYSRAIQLNPLEPIFWKNRGTCYSELGEHDKAITDYSKALELSSEDASTLNRRALAYDKLGQNEQAQADWKAALELLKKSLAKQPGDDSADWFALAIVHWRLGNKNPARNSFEQAVLRMGQSQQPTEWLLQIRSETAALLELTDPPVAIASQPPMSA